MKRIAAWILVCLFCLSLAGCGGGGSGSGSGGTGGSGTGSTQAPSQPDGNPDAPEGTEEPESSPLFYIMPDACSLIYDPAVFQCTESTDQTSFVSFNNSHVYVSLVLYRDMTPEALLDGILLQNDLTEEDVSDGSLGSNSPVDTKTTQYTAGDLDIAVHVLPCGDGALLVELGGIGDETPDELTAKGIMLDSFALLEGSGLEDFFTAE